MADQHDTHNQGGGFWGCATIFLALGFAACAAISGAGLIFGGMALDKKDPNAEANAASAAAPAPAPAPAVPAPAGGTPATPAAAGGEVAVTIHPNPANALTFDTTLITAKPGQKVKITYINQHPTTPIQHNLLICKPGSRQRIIDAANAMMTDMPKWMAKDYIPETADVLHHTKLINPNETVILEFVAGEKGDYPYICTFPGHSLIMQGTLKVE